MSSDPTLEQIVKDGWLRRYASGLPCYTQDLESTIELLATETLELRNRVNGLDAQARGLQEDGALAAGRGADDCPGTIIARQRGLWDAIDRFQDEVSAATGWSIVSAKAYEGEFIRFVDAVIRQRDEYRSLLSSTIRERTTALAQRDTARAALRKYAKHRYDCPCASGIATRTMPGGLKVSECNCGFANDALAGGEANEGSGS